MDLLSSPLRPRHYWILAVASMEQIIGAALSTVAGVMIPMMKLMDPRPMPTLLQGLVGAASLIGIGVGSSLIGSWANRQGYLAWFRICPAIILAASLLLWLVDTTWMAVLGLFLVGVGVGGGYSLDSSYVSELMPRRWQLFMVGVAKGTCAIGFLAAAVVAYLIIQADPRPQAWNTLILIIAALGALTLLMRLRWAQSPLWLLERGEQRQADRAAAFFIKGATVSPDDVPRKAEAKVGINQLLRRHFKAVVFSGIPWACEGLGVYGFGVFMPVLVAALGIQLGTGTGIHAVAGSVEMTAVINFFIIPGFVVGLWMVRRVWHVSMLAWGFWGSAAGLGILLAAHLLHWPLWASVVGFLVFEVCLNAGPHLVTFIVPSQVFSVQARAAGNGLAATIGKVGAVAGVFIMPICLKAGGMTLLLAVSIAVMAAGAVVSRIYGAMCLPRHPHQGQPAAQGQKRG